MRGEVLGPMRRMGEGGAGRERREEPGLCQSESVARGLRRLVQTIFRCREEILIVQL